MGKGHGGLFMVYHIAICDDNKADIQYIQKLLQQWGETNHLVLKIECFPSAEAFLFCYAEDKTFDILLLDVEMGQMNGVELAHKIREGNNTIQIVFVTGYTDYLADGYDVAALHYLVKPVENKKFFTVLERARNMLLRQEQKIQLSVLEETVQVPLYEIKYIEVRGNYVTIHAKEDFTVKSTLGEIEKRLDSSFFRTGRTYILNLGFIRRVSKIQVELSEGEIIPLPRGAYKALNQAIICKT